MLELMTWRRICICCVLVPWTACRVVFGQDADAVMREARIYYDAGDFEQANVQYRSLQDANLLPWQGEVAAYDRGTALLAQGRWEEALNVFHAIWIEDSNMPLLSQRIKSNVALAKLLMAKSHLTDLEKNSTAGLDEYIKLFFLFREAFDDIETAKGSTCILDKAEGAKACGPYPDLDEMYLEASTLYAQLLNDFSKYTLSNTSLEEGGLALLSGAKAMQDHLVFLQNKVLGSSLEKQYLEFYLQQENSWGPLWRAVEINLQNEASRDKEKELLYQKSKEGFFKATELMEQKALVESQKSLQQSIDALGAFLKLVFRETTLKDTAQRLLVNYSLVIERDPLQKIALQSLQEFQSRIEPMVNDNVNHSLHESYGEAQRYLGLAVQSFKIFKPLHARMYLEEARYFIKDLVQKLAVASKEEPERVIKNAVDAQMLSLTLNRLRQPLDEHEGGGEDMDPLLLSSQKRTIIIAEGFYPAVISAQTKGFRGEANKPGKAAGCQNSPWDEVVPLFTKGMGDARQAREVFSKNITHRRTAMALQEQAIREWQEALKKLSQRKKTQTKESQPSKAENKQEQSLQQQQQLSQGGSSFNDVMILMQQMENEDRSQPQIMESPVKKEVEHPW